MPGRPFVNRTLATALCLASMCAHAAAEDNPQSPRRKADPPPLKVEVLSRGVSSRSAERDAATRLPIKHLTPEQTARVHEVISKRSMFRRLPNIQIDADPAVYQWFTHNPEAAVSIWRRLGISKFVMKETQPNVWYADAGDGSIGTVEVLHRSNNEHLLLCKGSYKSPLLTKPIQATAVMHLRNVSVADARDPDGATRIIHDLDLFVMFPSQTIDTVAKVISPVSHMIADRNFRELSLFVRFMNVAMEREPGWVEQLAGQLDGITPDQRTQMLKLCAQVYVASRRRGEDVSDVTQTGLEDAVAPYRPVIRAAGSNDAPPR